MVKRKKIREHLRGDSHEVARAERPSDLVPKYDSHCIYSLSGALLVRQAMSYRSHEGESTGGSGWNVTCAGMLPEDFVEKYEGLGFTVTVHEVLQKINYEKNLQVVREETPPERDELELQAQVLTLKLEDLTHQQVADKLDVDIKDVHKAYRRALK